MQPTTATDGVTVRVSDASMARRLRDVAPEGTTVVRVGPTGIGAIDPLVTVTDDDETALHADCSPAAGESIAADATAGTAAGDGDPDAVVQHAPDASRFPATGSQLPGLETGDRVVLGGCGWRDPVNPADHEAAGGFAEADTDEEAVVAAGRDLLGRGWGDACHDRPVADAWETARDADGAATVVVNAHGDAGDRLLLESAPLEVLEGAEAVARTVGADRIVVYAAETDDLAVDTVREAAEAYPNPPVPVDVATGPAVHRAGEPTMAIEAIEGNDRLEARISPPEPSTVGLFGRPTVVHTARTVAHLAAGLRGDETDTRVLRVTGDVAAPATVELPAEASLATALEAVTVEGEVKAVCVGGRFGGVTADLDVGVAPERLAAADLGSDGGVTVLSTDRCVLEFVGERTQYAADENCGRCVPCREGTVQLAELLREVYDGAYDPEGIEELVRVMDRSSVCAFGVQAGRPARTAIAEFESEVRAHAEGRCPADSCLATPEAEAT
jgi:NADH-quinone oxidoreductase subunit F